MIKIPVRVSPDLSPSLAYVMADSVRKHMPDAELIHVTDAPCDKLRGFDSQMIVKHERDYVDQLLQTLCSIEGQVLSLDYDIVMQCDVSDVFALDFDACFTSRPPTSKKLSQSYNMGVVFSKNPEFWNEVRRIYLVQPLRDGWMNSQTLVTFIAKSLGKKYKVMEIDGGVYNFSPATEFDDLAGKKIVHYKGRRKPWMLPPELRHEVQGNVDKVVDLIRNRSAAPAVGVRAEAEKGA